MNVGGGKLSGLSIARQIADGPSVQLCRDGRRPNSCGARARFLILANALIGKKTPQNVSGEIQFFLF